MLAPNAKHRSAIVRSTPVNATKLARFTQLSPPLRACVPDETFDSVRRRFSEQELINLTMAVVAINCWNRRAISFRYPVGSYQPKAVHA